MKVAELTKIFSRHPLCQILSDELHKSEGQDIYLEDLQGSAPAMVLAACHDMERPVVVVLNDEDEAGYFYNDMVVLQGDADVLFLPSGFRRMVKYGRVDAAAMILRTQVAARLRGNYKSLVIVTYPEALSVMMASEKDVAQSTMELCVGDELRMDALSARLSEMGMTRTDYVYQPGQFSVRGSIMDIFSYALEEPVRLDFFGDTIDSIRTFDVTTQLSHEKCHSVTVATRVHSPGEAMRSFWSLLPDDTILMTRNARYVYDVVTETYATGFSSSNSEEGDVMSAADENDGSSEVANDLMLYNASDWETQTRRFRQVHLCSRPTDADGLSLSFKTQMQPLFQKNMELMASSFKRFREKGYDLYIMAADEVQHDRIRDILDGMLCPVSFIPVSDTLHAGFCDDTLKVCFYTDHQIFDRPHRYSLRSERVRGVKTTLALRDLREFEAGDYVVHIDHGIGRFEGLVRVAVGDSEQEAMKIVYGGGDVVYVSIHQLSKVSKYRSQDTDSPRLSRLGSGAWNALKERTKKRIKDIARDLIKLYSQRLRQKGFAFSKDSWLQYELEASFQYEDTPDQRLIAREVKADMESQKPMDRLICGDVGFGKTEIAIRAAFKAATDGKQVAVLVPTTVLAYQHYQTFSSRLKSFGVTVALLTRSQSAARTRQIGQELLSGEINIVIGTQKLLASSIKFKDLGLLIIDEEQKFGVATKERLRQIRVNIDTLSMSATPIPRTLQFSLMGARDLSVMHTPPPNRLPIQTEIHQFGHEIIADAIKYEISRGGQVFVVCNRIASLPAIRDLIVKYVPDVRVGVGHGQMRPHDLEKVIVDFINCEYDVLLSTTIIENGIDIPNANTIIIVDAQRYGLSDLHQMRGRVGRGGRKAFCYLLSPPFAAITPDARRRLEAIESFSELGSGLQIALQDLDLRGAGNLLGAEQSGFIADLGYETYQRVLSEAVAELKNDEFPQLTTKDPSSLHTGQLFVTSCTVDSDLPLFFSPQYIPTVSERIDLYRRLDSLGDDESVDLFRCHLEDRFGPLPVEASGLLKVNPLRRLACRLGVERIVLRQSRLMLYFVSDRSSAYYQSDVFGSVLAYLTQNPLRSRLEELHGKLRMTLTEVPSIDEALHLLETILQTPSQSQE